MVSQRNSKTTPEASWRKQIEDQRRSGLSIRLFCEERGLAVSTFTYWKRRLARCGGVATSLVPVRVVGRVEADDEAGGAAIEVVLTGGRSLRVSPGFDAATLVRVVEALEGRGAC